MKVFAPVMIGLSFLLLAAHFSRAGMETLVWASLGMPFLLAVRRPWSGWVLRVALALGGIEWLRTLWRLVAERRVAGEPWGRLASILAAVALVTFVAAWLAGRHGPRQVAPVKRS
jgi:hypothetical protein